MIGIVDYGLGNIQAFYNIYERLHIPVMLLRSASDFERVQKIILPGVGAFDYAMTKLNQSGMKEALEENVLGSSRKKVLGVCVGMQIMASNSEEGQEAGLGWIDGSVLSLEKHKKLSGLPTPHMGWNKVETLERSSLMNTGEDFKFYFLHSFYFQCRDESHTAAYASYGESFCCAIEKENIFGVQFHPEKSHDAGVSLLKSFAEL